MGNAPIHIDSRAWTGDPEVPPIERKVLGQRSLVLKSARKTWVFTSLAAVGGLLAYMTIDLLIWIASGSPPYFEVSRGYGALWFSIAVGAGFAASMLLIGRRKLLPLVPLIAIVSGGLVSSRPYVVALQAQGSVETATFYIGSIRLTNSGRRSFRTKRIQASAELIGNDGRSVILKGRYDYIRQLTGQDCMTVFVRRTGAYGFPTGQLALVETPYIDSISGKRHPERCFVNSAYAPQPG